MADKPASGSGKGAYRLRLAGSAEKAKKHSAKKRIWTVAGCAVLAVAVSVLLWLNLWSLAQQAPPEIVPAAKATPITETTQPFCVSEVIAQAHEKNPDTAGWLYLPACEVDDPVLQGADNEQYLRRAAFSADYDVWGCYFLDYINVSDGSALLDRVSIVYGHSLDNYAESEKFSKLKRYKSADVAAANPTFTFSLLHETHTYEIFAASDVPIAIDYIDPNPGDEKYGQTLQYLLEHSYVDFGVNVTTDDQILILFTCTADANVRFVLAGKLIK